MKDFSGDRASAFEGLHEPHISVLFSLLQESGVRSRDYIKRRYLERASRFDSTLHFLTEIGAVHANKDDLIINRAFQTLQGPVTREDLATIVIDLIVCTESCFRSEMFEYIKRFRVTDGRAVYKPSLEQRSAESGVRNLLMEWGVVAFDSSENQYVLAPEYAAVYAHAQHCGRSVSPAELQCRRRNKEDLGLGAEQAIVAYECERVGPGLADRIEHVALKNVAAGYDIQSVSVTEGNGILPRYIEVKAVPPHTLRFYWTANEVRVAEFFGLWYYLYLLPVDRQGVFNLQGLRMIADPHSAVFGSAGEWIVESDVMQCSLASHTG